MRQRRNMGAEMKLCDMRLLLRLCIDDKTREREVSTYKKHISCIPCNSTEIVLFTVMIARL